VNRSDTPGPDPFADAVDDAEQAVRDRRRAGEVPSSVQQALQTRFTSVHAEAPERFAHIASGRALDATTASQRAQVFAKRVVRRMLAWYVHPITVDQSRFNESIVGLVRSVERRVQLLEPPPSSRQTHALTAGLDESRQRLLRTLQSRGEPVVVIDDPRHARDVDPDAPPGCIFMPAALTRCSGAGVLALVRGAAQSVRPGGWVAADAPDPAHPAAGIDPSGIDIAMQRWLVPETMCVLFGDVGLVDAEVISVHEVDGVRAWYAVVARRPG
jgi:hypothetical protein